MTTSGISEFSVMRLGSEHVGWVDRSEGLATSSLGTRLPKRAHTRSLGYCLDAAYGFYFAVHPPRFKETVNNNALLMAKVRASGDFHRCSVSFFYFPG